MGGAADFKVGYTPIFPNVGVQASKYQSVELKFSHLYSTE